MEDKTGVVYLRVGLEENQEKLIPIEVRDLDFSFKHPLISHVENLVFALNPDYVEYAIYLEMDIDKEDVDKFIKDLVVINDSNVRDGKNIFQVIKYSTYYPSIFD